MNVVGDEGKPSYKLLHFWMIYFGTAQQDISTSGSDQIFRMVVESSGLHHERESGISLDYLCDVLCYRINVKNENPLFWRVLSENLYSTQQFSYLSSQT